MNWRNSCALVSKKYIFKRFEQIHLSEAFWNIKSIWSIYLKWGYFYIFCSRGQMWWEKKAGSERPVSNILVDDNKTRLQNLLTVIKGCGSPCLISYIWWCCLLFRPRNTIWEIILINSNLCVCMKWNTINMQHIGTTQDIGQESQTHGPHNSQSWKMITWLTNWHFLRFLFYFKS